MKTIELNISEDAYIVCTIQEKESYRYVSYRDILEEIDILSRQIKDISIMNNNIIFETKSRKVIIKNYLNNRDINLDYIIERLINEKKRRRREYLKKQKIKRQRILAGGLILSVGIIGNNLFLNFFPTNINAYTDNAEVPEIIVSAKIEKNISNENIVFTEIDTNNLEYKEEINEIDVAFESRTDTEKFKTTKAYYKDVITNISNEYGIDPQIMLAIATQESGIHTTNTNSSAIGLMQIERAVWNNQTISAYNYKKQTEETYKITEEKLKDLEFNIRVSCMYFQKCLKDSNYNLSVAIQMYNYGYGNIEKTFKMYYNDDIVLIEALNNYDPEWLECRNNMTIGDNLYLEHILSYIEDLDNIKCLKNNVTINYKINQKSINKII